MEIVEQTVPAAGNGGIKLLLITANVGSIFEETEHTLPQWIASVSQAIAERQPHFVAIHMQEVGGKSYKTGMRLVDGFLQLLDASPALEEFDRRLFHCYRDFTTPYFTALGSLYYIHRSVGEVRCFHFAHNLYIPLPIECSMPPRSQRRCAGFFGDDGSFFPNQPTPEDCELFAESQPPHPPHYELTQHEKFPESFFPQCSWSRKGFLRTRWVFPSPVPIDLINLHLFHDDSNLVALEKSPSVYAENRVRAFKYVLKRCEASDKPCQVYFGDVNFRLDLARVVRYLSNGGTPQVLRDKNGAQTRVIVRINSTVASAGAAAAVVANSAPPTAPHNNGCSSSSSPLCTPIVVTSADKKIELQSPRAVRATTAPIAVPRIRTPSPISEPAYPLSPAPGATAEEALSATGATPAFAETERTISTGSLLSPEGSTFASTSPSSSPSTHALNQQLLFPSNAIIVEKKTFIVPDPDRFLRNQGREFLTVGVVEPEFMDNPVLHEFPLDFPPSYPFSEDASAGSTYMTTRCPSWCDRIFLTKTAFDIASASQPSSDVCDYTSIASDVCVGDHKPVLLSFALPPLSAQPS
ncbi:inositol polyphosphate-5-phosphatase A [Capsaspora owczarzaki ATCC 30864]|uniref:inositol-polyphosphate 5-phosphatase n=1 Tax=Capsaspora owczarzaki (strain ATCC 30864) TaxID=595528 RepID=A0A0D2U056_CAPO3|nr:inositol polyphosphate-5-phosphatase A [Capsaspora owczarzaki ATCC 30864]KJE88561.1 inositol polyphosphate-5-phosphatase A [Capsaspora owczarzaki ATCC 30864]|eukprot:XP_004365071.1 inositol polyphosphate-5-phosphatase A [Capsaspora owczarzaki ATCC 30864]